MRRYMIIVALVICAQFLLHLTIASNSSPEFLSTIVFQPVHLHSSYFAACSHLGGGGFRSRRSPYIPALKISTLACTLFRFPSLLKTGKGYSVSCGF